MSGDLLWHNTVWMSAQAEATRTRQGTDGFDFGPMFAAIKPIIEGADLAICHEEVPFAAPGGPYKNYPVFAAPPQIARGLAAVGWDACTTSSNHSLDDGWDGLVRTAATLRAQGIVTTGTHPTVEDSRTPTILTTKAGVKVGIVAGTYDLNGFQPPAGKEWSVDTLDPAQMLARAHAARQAGADIVLAYIHGGDEYQTLPNAQQRQLAAALAASPDVDLVYGSHVHVAQPFTRINGKWVAYGMGNLVAAQPIDMVRGAEGYLPRFTFTEKPTGGFEVTKPEYIPTLVTHSSLGPVRVYPVNAALAAGLGDAVRLRAARQRTMEAVTALGEHGVVEG